MHAYDAPGYYYDFGGFPIVCDKATTPLRADHVEELAWIMDTALGRRERVITISDARGGADATADYRRAVGEYLERIEPLSARYTIASILVLDSALGRAVVTGITWWRRPAVPLLIVKDMKEAAQLARARWEQDGQMLTPEINRYLERVAKDEIRYEKVRC